MILGMSCAFKQAVIIGAFCLGFTPGVLPFGQATATTKAVDLTIRPQAPTTPFPHFWEQMFGSGRAILSLRDSYRRDLRAMKAATGIQYVRFHAIFHDEIGVYEENQQGEPVFNWSYVDQIYDGLLENGVRPFVELSFMPSKLAASQAPHAFWYKLLPSPPKNYVKWEALINAFARHLLDRYGADEVSRWYFEVWNEPNIDFWTGEPKQATYFELYDHAAKAVKRADARLRVGGPATAQAAWVPAMIAHSVAAKVPLDFVSTHVYANDTPEDVFHSHADIPRSEMVARAVGKVYQEVKQSSRPDLPIYWSEYNASYKNEIDITDSTFMGPWLANTIRECDGLTAAMSYWTFSDVFEEQGVVKTPFYGGFGLIAEGGIPKAAFNAFMMLHKLGERRLQPELANAIVTKRADGTLVLAVWNYASDADQGDVERVRVHIAGWKTEPRIQVEVLDPKRGSALTAWKAMGAPRFPTREQYQALRRTATATEKLNSSTFMLPPQGLALVEVQGQ